MFICLFAHACIFAQYFYNLRLHENLSIIFISFGAVFTGFLKRNDRSLLRWRRVSQEGDQVGS